MSVAHVQLSKATPPSKFREKGCVTYIGPYGECSLPVVSSSTISQVIPTFCDCVVRISSPDAILGMGRRYFCDYCDRSFQDNLHNRKKHLNGVQHQRCKKAWYDLFRGNNGRY